MEQGWGITGFQPLHSGPPSLNNPQPCPTSVHPPYVMASPRHPPLFLHPPPTIARLPLPTRSPGRHRTTNCCLSVGRGQGCRREPTARGPLKISFPTRPQQSASAPLADVCRKNPLPLKSALCTSGRSPLLAQRTFPLLNNCTVEGLSHHLQSPEPLWGLPFPRSPKGDWWCSSHLREFCRRTSIPSISRLQLQTFTYKAKRDPGFTYIRSVFKSDTSQMANVQEPFFCLYH